MASALAGTRFADVRWVAETGSTNADVLTLARGGALEGVVEVADHQTAGRGRQGRSWTAPPGASLLASVLLRPSVRAAGATTMAMAVSAADALEAVAGVAARLKWPNDLVWPGDGSAPDRKLAGILAEADWPSRREPGDEGLTVVVGIGLNVNWPAALPGDLADTAVAANHICGREVDREELLIALLLCLDRWYGDASVFVAWRERSATIGRQVRVDLGGEELVGAAVDVTADGHLVLDLVDGTRRAVAVGDVIHLRDA